MVPLPFTAEGNDMKINAHADMSLAEYRRLICLQLAVEATRVYPSKASGEIKRAKKYEEYLRVSRSAVTGGGINGEGGNPAAEWCPICNCPNFGNYVQRDEDGTLR